MTISYDLLKTPSEMLALPHKLLTLLTLAHCLHGFILQIINNWQIRDDPLFALEEPIFFS